MQYLILKKIFYFIDIICKKFIILNIKLKLYFKLKKMAV